MAWKRLEIGDLRTVLAENEIQKLAEISKSEELADRIQSCLDNAADLFRGAFLAKGYEIDIREHYIPQSYVLPVLNYSRWQIWTVFPMTQDYALSEPRKYGYDEARELLKNPYIGVEKPDYSDDPELSGKTSTSTDASLTVPWLKLPPVPFEYGFPKAYYDQFDGLSAFI